MSVTADSVVVDLIVNADQANAAVDQSTAKFEAGMERQSRSAAKAEAAAAKAAQRKAEAEERAAARIAEAAEKARIRQEEAANKAAIRAQEAAAKAAASNDAAEQRKAAAAERGAQRAAEAAEKARLREVEAAKRAAIAVEAQRRREASAADIAATRAAQAAQRAANQAANGSRNFGRQIADIGLGLQSPGVSPFLVLAQQGPQVADALADVGGRVGKFATFLSGPVGAAIFATVTAAGLLASKLLETGDTAESLAKDLEQSEQKARAADAAQTAFSQTLLGAAKASRELNAELTKQNQSQLQVAQSALAVAEAQRQSNIQTRQKIADQLREQLNNAKNLRDDIARGNPLTSPEADEANQQALAVYTLRITRLQGDYAIAQKAVADATNATVQARIPLLAASAEAQSSRQVDLTQKHAAALDVLKANFEKAATAANKLDGAARQSALNAAEADYIAAAAAENDKFTASTEALSEAKREANKVEAEAAKLRKAALKDAKELQADLEKLESAYDPLAASARAYADELERIADLQTRGLLTPQKADQYRAAANAARIIAAGGVGGDSVEDILNRPGGISDSVKRDDERIQQDREREQASRKAQADTEDYLYRERERNIYTLADIYRTAFERGAKGIGETLKFALIDAISQALARKTIGAFASLLGGGGGSGGGLFSSIFGRASGGYAAPRSLHRVNETAGGVELLRMGPTGGEVIPLGRAQASNRGGGVTVMQTIAVDARGAVMNDQFAQLILNQADQNARQITAVGSKAAYESSPQRFQRQNLLGT